MRDIAAWAVSLPPESATGRALEEHPGRTNELDMLRQIEADLRVLDWTLRGRKGDAPEPIPLPWDPPREGAWVGDAIEWDDITDALGDDPRLLAVMNRINEATGGE